MTTLVDRDIIFQMTQGNIVIDPFDRACLGTNSYDVHLSNELRVYEKKFTDLYKEIPLDVYEERGTTLIEIPQEGHVLQPGIGYLASTIEYTETREHLPIINGKSSLGRLFLSIHATAGTGDVGFKGHWTLELSVIQPLRIYAGMRIAQLLYFGTQSTPLISYDRKYGAKYGGRDQHPQASRMHRERVRKSEED
jgi:dCTP deaminase